MIRYAEAKKILLDYPAYRGTTEIPLDAALGRVAARDYFSPEAIPVFPRSEVDGFAVISSETREATSENPIRLPVLGVLSSRDVPLLESSERGAWKVMAGALIPHGFDAVLLSDSVRIQKDAQGRPMELLLEAPVLSGLHSQKVGEDFQVGNLLLNRGNVITPVHLLVLSSLGISKVVVVDRPRVVVVSAGNSLGETNTSLGQNPCRSSSALYLGTALKQWGADVVFQGSVSDRVQEFMGDMEKILAMHPDLLITTGGVSSGRHDFIPPAFADLGAQRGFYPVAVWPGKPVFFSHLLKGPAIFGVSEDPVSTVLGLRFFLEPFLREWMGRREESFLRIPLQKEVHLAEKPDGFLGFSKARLQGEAGNTRVELLSGQGLESISPLLEANAWAILPELKNSFQKGELIEVAPGVTSGGW